MKAKELLYKVLSGESVTSSDIDDLLNEQIAENQYLDYKDAKALEKKNKPGQMIRAYISAFANSDGGILIIGVNGKEWRVSGGKAPGGGNLSEWASRTLAPIAGYFTTQPRFQVIEHTNGEILVIGIDRSGSLIPVVESANIVFYIRIHDQTLSIPEYLISDLIHGKRQQPRLRILESYIRLSPFETKVSNDMFLDLNFNIHLNIGNESLVWAEEVLAGFIFWSKMAAPLVGDYIRRELIIQEETHDFKMHLHHNTYRVPISPLPAYQNTEFQSCANGTYTLQQMSTNRWYPRNWKAAIYLVAKNSMPVWYQLEVSMLSDLVRLDRSSSQLTPDNDFMSLEIMETERPIVAVAQIDH